MNIGTLKIAVSGSATTIDCDWNDGLTELPAGVYPLCVTHDDAAAVRLRGICGDLGLGSAIPETNERLMALQFAATQYLTRGPKT